MVGRRCYAATGGAGETVQFGDAGRLSVLGTEGWEQTVAVVVTFAVAAAAVPAEEEEYEEAEEDS